MKTLHIVTAGTVTAALAAALLGVARHPSIWESWRPATCMPAHCFCEAIRSQLVRQPANAVSGLAFVGVAILVLFAARTVRAGVVAGHPFTSQPVYPVLFACAALLIGLGTTFYHASLTFWGQTADVLGMYLLATLLVLHNLARIVRLAPRHAALLYIVGNTLLLALLVAQPGARRYVFGVLIVLALALEYAARRTSTIVTRRPLLLLAAGSLLLGFLIWVLDITRTVCAPASWLQGHAVWHLAGAAAVWFVFLYYNSATPERAR